MATAFAAGSTSTDAAGCSSPAAASAAAAAAAATTSARSAVSAAGTGSAPVRLTPAEDGRLDTRTGEGDTHCRLHVRPWEQGTRGESAQSVEKKSTAHVCSVQWTDVPEHAMETMRGPDVSL